MFLFGSRIRAGVPAGSDLWQNASMTQPPFDVHLELDGWELFWAHLELSPTAGDAARELLAQTAARARERLELATLSKHPTVQAVRRLFRAAGCDPTRYRPSSEALLRRVLKGDELPAIHPLVDLNNALSVELAVPSCVMAEGSITPPVVLRAGRAGETYLSLRGPFNLEGKPLLADVEGPFGTPISDSERVRVSAETRRAWLVAYLPRGVVESGRVTQAMTEMSRGVALGKWG